MALLSPSMKKNIFTVIAYIISFVVIFAIVSGEFQHALTGIFILFVTTLIYYFGVIITVGFFILNLVILGFEYKDKSFAETIIEPKIPTSENDSTTPNSLVNNNNEQDDQCLRDNRFRELETLVKWNMNDQSSFVHEATILEEIKGSDYYAVVMRFRGTNVYGAVVLNHAAAIIERETCEIKDWGIKEVNSVDGVAIPLQSQDIAK